MTFNTDAIDTQYIYRRLAGFLSFDHAGLVIYGRDVTVCRQITEQSAVCRVEERALLVQLGDGCLNLVSLAFFQCDRVLRYLHGLHVCGACTGVSAYRVNRDAVSDDDFLSVLDLVRRNIIFVVVVRLEILLGVDAGFR